MKKFNITIYIPSLRYYFKRFKKSHNKLIKMSREEQIKKGLIVI